MNSTTPNGRRIDGCMNPSEPLQFMVSVLIRIRNEEHALCRLLECLRMQTLGRPFEVVVIDNESEDESASVARAMGARVFTFPRSRFGYGRALNAGVTLCHGDLIVLLSAHSWPLGNDWLSRMVDCVETHAVAAAYCRQRADGKVPRQERTRFKAFAHNDYTLDPKTLVQRCASGEDVYQVCCFSNAAAIIRRDVVRRFPFRDLPFAEDRAFVLDCVMGGHSIAYLSTASVTYQQPVSFRNFYRLGWACNTSKHLIRELGSEAVGTDLRKSELCRKVVRLLCKPIEIVGRTIEALVRDRSQVGRASRYAAVSCAMAVGCIVGELTWRRHRQTTCRYSSVLVATDNSISIAAERVLPPA